MAPSMSTGYTDADSSRVVDYRSHTLHSSPKANLRQSNGENPADGLARYVLELVNVGLYTGKQRSDETTGLTSRCRSVVEARLSHGLAQQ